MLRGLIAALLAVLVGAGAAFAAGSFLLDLTRDQGRVSERWQRGFNFTAFLPDAYGEPTANLQLLRAVAAGTERIVLTPTWYMADAGSEEIVADASKTPTDASLRAVAAEARRLGLAVVIKPHVDVVDGTFRGEILPLDAETWFNSYGRMIMRYANLAAELDADALIVGTELTSMTLDPEPWRELIDGVRERYDGPLSFAANWVDGAETIEFWNELDFIGIDAYMPLATPIETPTLDDLVEAWGPFVARMEALRERWDLPLLFTELGYQDRVGTASRQGQDHGAIDPEAQAIAYEAAFEALSGERWFRGIWWWEWSAEGPPVEAGGFTPQGKPAVRVLVDWLGPARVSGPEPSAGSESR